MISALRLTMLLMAVPASAALALQGKPQGTPPATPKRPPQATRPEKLRTDGWRDFDLRTPDFRFDVPNMDVWMSDIKLDDLGKFKELEKFKAFEKLKDFEKFNDFEKFDRLDG